jgi:hypothetical protein
LRGQKRSLTTNTHNTGCPRLVDVGGRLLCSLRLRVQKHIAKTRTRTLRDPYSLWSFFRVLAVRIPTLTFATLLHSAWSMSRGDCCALCVCEPEYTLRRPLLGHCDRYSPCTFYRVLLITLITLITLPPLPSHPTSCLCTLDGS